MVIENRDAVVAGTKLVGTYKKQQYVCKVEAGEDGKLAFMYDGKSYGSPSSAGTAVIGSACNGWRFWSIEGDAPVPAKAQAKTKAATVRPASPRRSRSSSSGTRTRRSWKPVRPAGCATPASRSLRSMAPAHRNHARKATATTTRS